MIPLSADSYTDSEGGILRALSMFSQVSFKVGEGEDADEYIVTTDKRSGFFTNIDSMNVYTDLLHYPSAGGVDFESIENYLNINHSSGDIRQGFITTWLRARTRSDTNLFSVEYDHMYLPVSPSSGYRNGITYQAFDDGNADRIFYDVSVTADLVQHNNYTGENVHIPISLSKEHIGVRGTGFVYTIDPIEVCTQAGIHPELVPSYLHLVNVRITLYAHSNSEFEMRAFNVMNDLVPLLEARTIIDEISSDENSGSALDDFALDELFKGVVDLLKVEVFPGISIWLIMSSIMGILLLVWFVKLFAGG